ncbi:MAG: PEP-CTERM sorting domain-containing protein [Isosphaeraceae bacterium]
MVLIAGAMEANAGSLTYSHHSTALPDAAGPAITMLSITGTNDGTSLTFIITFANPTIEGPSSASDDAVYGFVNLDTDNDAGTGVSGSFLDTNGLQPGFGQYSPAAHGIDAYINLTSEGDPLHGAPGLVDLVSTSTFTPIATLPVLYVDGGGNTPSTLTFSIALSILADNQIPLGDTGDFSVIVGNLNNATDFLPSSVIPEPSSLGLFGLGLVSSLLLGRRLRR